MTLEQLLAALAKLPEGTVFAEALKAIIAAKEAEITQKNAQYKTLTKTLKDAEDKLKASNKRLEKFYDHLNIDEDVDDLDTALTDALKNSQKGGDAALLKRIEKLEKARQKDKDDSDKLISEERGKRHDLLKRQTLLSALTAGNATRADELVGLLLGKVQIDENDELIFIDEKGQAGKVEDGVKNWLTDRPDFVKNEQRPGAGSGAGGGAGGGDDGNLGKTVAAKVAENSKASTDAQAHFFG